MRWLLLVLTLSVLSLGFVACGDDDDDAATATPGGGTATATSAGGDSTVSVELRDYSINADKDTVSAGNVDFQLSNTGPSVHEFVLVKTDLDPGDLPTEEDGAVNEDSDDFEAIDEVEDVDVGGGATLSADLEPGHYVFFCNIVEEDGDQTIAHYTSGMRGEITVE